MYPMRTCPDCDNPLRKSRFKGSKWFCFNETCKVIYVDFWATWCGPCVEAIPELNEVHAKYEPRGFAVLGISVDDLSLEAISHFAETEKMAYPVALGSTEDMSLFGPSPGLPTGYLVDREGVVVKKFIGQLPVSALEAEIEKALGAQE